MVYLAATCAYVLADGTRWPYSRQATPFGVLPQGSHQASTRPGCHPVRKGEFGQNECAEVAAFAENAGGRDCGDGVLSVG